MIDWGSLDTTRTERGAGVRVDVVRLAGNPDRVRHPFFHLVPVVDDGCGDAYDIQTVAAHEIGHVFQFDHVTNRWQRTTPK